MRQLVAAAALAQLVACNNEKPSDPLPQLPSSVDSPTEGLGVVVAGAGVGCPPGMVRVKGKGTVGMRGQPYGIVPTHHLEKVDSPERLCPDAVAKTKDATACWVQTDLVDPVLVPRAVSIPEFCIEQTPFPGGGVEYPVDGMTAGAVALLDQVLQTGRYGTRRLCTSTEYQMAVAGPQSNLRFVYGDEADPERCKAGARIGQNKRCVNPETGVMEYGAIHSHWTTADPDFVVHACAAPPCKGAGNRPLAVGSYVVMGGTDRVQTRQAPLTPHTWHDHGEPAQVGCGDQGWDDQAVICADPDPRYSMDTMSAVIMAQEGAWASLRSRVRKTGRISQGLEVGLGRAVCPSPVDVR